MREHMSPQQLYCYYFQASAPACAQPARGDAWARGQVLERYAAAQDFRPAVPAGYAEVPQPPTKAQCRCRQKRSLAEEAGHQERRRARAAAARAAAAAAAAPAEAGAVSGSGAGREEL